MGMDALQLSKLFMPFTQADASTTRRFGGTGLGLAICKQLVELMGGQIQVISQPGQGSDFQFTLPFKVDHMADSVPSAKTLVPTNQPLAANVSRLKGLRILLVEDNALNQEVARELLTSIAGAEVTIANNGQEALDCLNLVRPDLVLMDVQMPVMDGYEATKHIRSQSRWVDLPIIAMTAHALPQDRERCLLIGMNDHVTKPFYPEQIFAVLSKWARPRLAEGVSFEQGLSNCMGRATLYATLLGHYLSTSGVAAVRIRQALEQGDHAQAGAALHDLVSNAGTIGAMALAAAASELQRAIIAREEGRWPDLLQDLAVQQGAADVAVNSYLAQRELFAGG